MRAESAWPAKLRVATVGRGKKPDLIKSILIAVAERRPREEGGRAADGLARAAYSLNIQARPHRLKSCLWLRCCVAPGFCGKPEPTRGSRSLEMIGGPEGPSRLIGEILPERRWSGSVSREEGRATFD
ncbi:hypothetical protein KM043_016717 [Ampulex compressa]|nr:hypothetical protein KM043_016717 [Ampulex compressa]